MTDSLPYYSVLKTLDITARGVKAAGALAWGSVAVAASLVNVIIQRLLPRTMTRLMWNILFKLNVPQLPGITVGMFDKFAPTIVKHIMRGTDRNESKEINMLNTVGEYVLSTQRFGRYDPVHDRFIKSDSKINPTDISPGHVPTERNLDRVDMPEYGYQLKGALADLPRRGDFIQLPRPVPMQDVQLLPLEVALQGSDRSIQRLPLQYDKQGNFFVDASQVDPQLARQAGAASVRFLVHFPERKGSIFTRSGLAKRYPRGWALPKPELDTVATEADYDFPPELEQQIEQWRRLPNNRKIVEQVREYLHTNFAYPQTPLAALAIQLARGRTAVERIARAKIGNCYDVNKLGYIILQRCGVPAEFHKGLATGTIKDNQPRTSQVDIIPPKDLVPGDQVHARHIPTTVIPGEQTAQVTGAMRHAFLTYWDDVAKQMLGTDFTPYAKMSHIRYEQKISKRAQAARELVRRIDETMGWTNIKEFNQQLEAMDTDMRSAMDPFKLERFHVYFGSSFGAGMAPSIGSGKFYYKVHESRNPTQKYREIRKMTEQSVPYVEVIKQEWLQARAELITNVENAVDDFMHRFTMRPSIQRDWYNEVVKATSRLGEKKEPVTEGRLSTAQRAELREWLIMRFVNMFIEPDLALNLNSIRSRGDRTTRMHLSRTERVYLGEGSPLKGGSYKEEDHELGEWPIDNMAQGKAWLDRVFQDWKRQAKPYIQKIAKFLDSRSEPVTLKQLWADARHDIAGEPYPTPEPQDTPQAIRERVITEWLTGAIQAEIVTRPETGDTKWYKITDPETGKTFYVDQSQHQIPGKLRRRVRTVDD